MPLPRKDHVSWDYDLIVKAFGPSQEGDPDKVLAEWQLTTPYGWAEVYDFKSYASSVYEVEEWHVQADNDEAFDWVYEQIESARRAEETEG